MGRRYAVHGRRRALHLRVRNEPGRRVDQRRRSTPGSSGSRSVDDYTVTIHFEDVNSGLVAAVRRRPGHDHPPPHLRRLQRRQRPGRARQPHAIGTGPYRVVEYRTEDVLLIGEDAVETIRIIYEPNPYYREPDKPFFRVELQGGGGDAAYAGQVVVDDLADFSWNVQGDESLFHALEARRPRQGARLRRAHSPSGSCSTSPTRTPRRPRASARAWSSRTRS